MNSGAAPIGLRAFFSVTPRAALRLPARILVVLQKAWRLRQQPRLSPGILNCLSIAQFFSTGF
ncbi:MAG: hypothetical protein EBU32_00945 [Opitutaceae bacterium]|nr:hypothetical protein [Opitutaceae bacterium]